MALSPASLELTGGIGFHPHHNQSAFSVSVFFSFSGKKQFIHSSKFRPHQPCRNLQRDELPAPVDLDFCTDLSGSESFPHRFQTWLTSDLALNVESIPGEWEAEDQRQLTMRQNKSATFKTGEILSVWGIPARCQHWTDPKTLANSQRTLSQNTPPLRMFRET